MATLAGVTSLTQSLSLKRNDVNGSNNLRDVSFSFYLNNREELLVRTLGTHREDQEEINDFLGKKKVEDGEIGVFSAEKYFNGVIDDENSSLRLANISLPRKYSTQLEEQQQPKKEDEQNELISIKPKVLLPFAGTPSIVSESSSNSQTGLLQNLQRKTTITTPVLQRKTSNKASGIRTSGMNFLANLGYCKCSCADKDAIDIDDNHVGEISFKRSPNPSGNLQNKEIAQEFIMKNNLGLDRSRSGPLMAEEIHSNSNKLGIGKNKETCFSFRSTPGNLVSKSKFRDEGDIIPRKSLEVFSSPVHDKKSKSFRIEGRLSMLSWDTNPRMEETSSGLVYNDNESDASSDLFEIESLTGKVTPFLARQGSDATSGCVTPATCYAPSEASIEWSVVTASAADFSVISDYEERRPSTTAPSPIKIFPVSLGSKITGNGNANGKKTPRRRPSMLLGCNSNKAVKVAGDAYKTNDNKVNLDGRKRRVSNFYMPVTRFPAENKLMGFDSRQNQHSLNTTHSLPRMHPPQSSRLLYI